MFWRDHADLRWLLHRGLRRAAGVRRQRRELLWRWGICLPGANWALARPGELLPVVPVWGGTCLSHGLPILWVGMIGKYYPWYWTKHSDFLKLFTDEGQGGDIDFCFLTFKRLYVIPTLAFFVFLRKKCEDAVQWKVATYIIGVWIVMLLFPAVPDSLLLVNLVDILFACLQKVLPCVTWNSFQLAVWKSKCNASFSQKITPFLFW